MPNAHNTHTAHSLLKRVRDEDGSRFTGHHPLLHTRYVLMGLLGKGGFSEVHKVSSRFAFLLNCTLAN